MKNDWTKSEDREKFRFSAVPHKTAHNWPKVNVFLTFKFLHKLCSYSLKQSFIMSGELTAVNEKQ